MREEYRGEMPSFDDLTTSSGAPDAGAAAELVRLRARVAMLENLLDVRDGVVVDECHKSELLLERLVRFEANLRMLVERLPDAVFVHQGAAIQYANPAIATLLGYDEPAALRGRTA